MAATTFCALEKKLSPSIKYSKPQRKNVFSDHSHFFMSYHVTKIFVHLSIIAAVSNFNVFKLIGWDPGNTCLFKVNNRNPRKILPRGKGLHNLLKLRKVVAIIKQTN